MLYSRHFRLWALAFMLLVLAGLLSGCDRASHNSTHQQERVMTVKQQIDQDNLYYQGVIKPIAVQQVISPAEAIITSVDFSYGQFVELNQLLLTLSSIKLEQDFQQALSRFLTAKDRMLNSEVNFNGAKVLFEKQIISQQEYLSEKSQFENNKLSFLEEKIKLHAIVTEIPGMRAEIEQLTLTDIDQVTQMYRQHITGLPVNSPAKGIALFPDKSKPDDESKKLEVGAQVKQRQSLLSIGNMQGVRVEFEVGQKDINRIKKGLQVTISNDALGATTLKGEVNEVGVQATTGSSSEPVSFPIVVNVADIPDTVQHLLRVGMTAKVQIIIETKSQITVPIKAVVVENNKHFVWLIDPKTKKRTRQPVKTGKILLNEVVIIDGLSAGNQIVVKGK